MVKLCLLAEMMITCAQSERVFQQVITIENEKLILINTSRRLRSNYNILQVHASHILQVVVGKQRADSKCCPTHNSYAAGHILYAPL